MLGIWQLGLPFYGLDMEQVQDGSFRLHQEHLTISVLAEANKHHPIWLCTRPDLPRAVRQMEGTNGVERQTCLWEILAELHETLSLSLCYQNGDGQEPPAHTIYVTGGQWAPNGIHNRSMATWTGRVAACC